MEFYCFLIFAYLVHCATTTHEMFRKVCWFYCKHYKTRALQLSLRKADRTFCLSLHVVTTFHVLQRKDSICIRVLENSFFFLFNQQIGKFKPALTLQVNIVPPNALSNGTIIDNIRRTVFVTVQNVTDDRQRRDRRTDIQ